MKEKECKTRHKRMQNQTGPVLTIPHKVINDCNYYLIKFLGGSFNLSVPTCTFPSVNRLFPEVKESAISLRPYKKEGIILYISKLDTRKLNKTIKNLIPVHND